MNDQKTGYGEEIVKGKYEYKGDFVDGVFHGNGLLKLSDGTIYQGEFKNGQMDGQGTVIRPLGCGFAASRLREQ